MKRTGYFIAFAVILLIEILIGAFVHDQFIRPYLGDVLVTVLLCCLGRCILPKAEKLLPLGIFLLALIVECAQLIHIPALEGTLLGIILGSTFDWMDLICYAVGCLIFRIAECAICARKDGTT